MEGGDGNKEMIEEVQEEVGGGGGGGGERGGSGGGRTMYECMFCRGGFMTAQALGGHMNIHRRERARMMLQLDLPQHQTQLLPPPPPPPSFYGLITGPRFTKGSSSSQGGVMLPPPTPPPSFDHDLIIDCCTERGSSSSSSSSQARVVSLELHRPPDGRPSTELPLFHEDHDSHNEDELGQKEEEEVDLELRLGRGRIV